MIKTKPLEQYKKSRNWSSLIISNDFDKGAKETQWKRKISSTNGAGMTE